jgi:hypothetical protein
MTGNILDWAGLIVFIAFFVAGILLTRARQRLILFGLAILIGAPFGYLCDVQEGTTNPSWDSMVIPFMLFLDILLAMTLHLAYRLVRRLF